MVRTSADHGAIVKGAIHKYMVAVCMSGSLFDFCLAFAVLALAFLALTPCSGSRNHFRRCFGKGD